jgi:hypothetical protein
MKKLGLILLALTATGLAQSTPKPNVGTNLSSVNYFATQIPFVDVFKTAKAWHSATSSTWDDGRTITTDTNGNVTKLEAGQFARTLVLREIGGHYPIGEYTLTFQGEGQLDIGFAAKVLERKGNTIRLEVKKSVDGILIDIRSTNPQNPIRDIRLTMPGGICQGNVLKRQTSATECAGKPFLEYLNAWKNSGGQAFMHFTDIGTYSKWGRWGSLENLYQTRAEAPKFDAIMTFLEK